MWPVSPVAWVLFAVFCTSCGGGHKKAPLPRPVATDLLSSVIAKNQLIRSYRAESTMDFWTGGERIRATVLTMGQIGSKIRINALNPDGGSTAVDLACDGSTFRFVDYNQNCFLEGPCSKHSVAQLLRLELHPDEFRYLVFGGVPLLETTDVTVEWDPKRGKETLTLKGANDQRQVLTLGTNGEDVEVLRSQVLDDGKITWEITHKDFSPLGGIGEHKGFLAPRKGRFVQTEVKSDLVVSWGERELNPTLPAISFELDIPKGLPECK